MAFLTRLFSRRNFPIPPFDLEPLAFELNRVSADEPGYSAPPPGTPGEMRESIERHLRLVRAEDDQPLLEQDAVDELRDAIAELRRSLG